MVDAIDYVIVTWWLRNDYERITWRVPGVCQHYVVIFMLFLQTLYKEDILYSVNRVEKVDHCEPEQQHKFNKVVQSVGRASYNLLLLFPQLKQSICLLQVLSRKHFGYASSWLILVLIAQHQR